MSEYIFSPAQNMICARALKNDYVLAGTWPADALALEGAIAIEFMGEAPQGKIMAAGPDKFPVWADVPPLTPVELIEQAGQYRNSLLSTAQDTISIWQTKLLLGRLSDSEKKSLNSWLDYIDEVEAIDTSTTTEIIWPNDPI